VPRQGGGDLSEAGVGRPRNSAASWELINPNTSSGSNSITQNISLIRSSAILMASWATRYEKRAENYLAMLTIAAIVL
jgi:hypothetical protein